MIYKMSRFMPDEILEYWVQNKENTDHENTRQGYTGSRK